jgi:hypothetical protein
MRTMGKEKSAQICIENEEGEGRENRNEKWYLCTYVERDKDRLRKCRIEREQEQNIDIHRRLLEHQITLCVFWRFS